jgi:peroxiredoxin (alkyl hydroperoxide reductase subunit C)
LNANNGRTTLAARFARATHQGGATMSDEATQARLGHPVPNFEINTYDPPTHGFGTFKLSENMAAGKWTILFFYPADFTFV